MRDPENSSRCVARLLALVNVSRVSPGCLSVPGITKGAVFLLVSEGTHLIGEMGATALTKSYVMTVFPTLLEADLKTLEANLTFP